MKGRQWLGNVSYQGGRFSVRHPSSVAQAAPDYSRCMDFAHQILADLNKVSFFLSTELSSFLCGEESRILLYISLISHVPI